MALIQEIFTMMLKHEDAVLVVIDIQDVLLPEDKAFVDAYLGNAVKMIQVARILGLPVLVTEQYPERLGTTNARIAAELEGIARIPKKEFGCLANAEFGEALRAAGRKQLVLMGMESHVCVLQTALTAMEAGYEVFLVADALSSQTRDEYEFGVNRMRQNGVQIVSVNMATFELLRAAGTPEFKKLLPLLK
jgi:nicotinamidase-related amidase